MVSRRDKLDPSDRAGNVDNGERWDARMSTYLGSLSSANLMEGIGHWLTFSIDVDIQIVL